MPERLKLEHLLTTGDGDIVSLALHAVQQESQQLSRWVVKRTYFRLNGVRHTLLMLSDVSAALREEERLAWERLIRVLGHEINNSLTPIKSIASSLRGRLPEAEAAGDFNRGLAIIEDRAESLNRFLQAYRRLMGLPVPKLAQVSLIELMERVVQLETRLSVSILAAPDVISADRRRSTSTGVDQPCEKRGRSGYESGCQRQWWSAGGSWVEERGGRGNHFHSG